MPPSPTLPFEEEQMTAILNACDRYPIMGIYNHGNRQRIKALPCSCAIPGCGSATPSRVRVIDSWARNFSVQAKTGTPVYCPLPPIVVDALSAVEGQTRSTFSGRETVNKVCRRRRSTIVPETLRARGG